MNSNIGDLVFIKPGTHFYPDSWRHGHEPARLPYGALAIILKIDPPRGQEIRTFFRIFTPMGEGWINSYYCKNI